MQAKHFGGLGLIPSGLGERIEDELAFKFANGIIQEDVFFDHLRNKRFQLLSHAPNLTTDGIRLVRATISR